MKYTVENLPLKFENSHNSDSLYDYLRQSRNKSQFDSLSDLKIKNILPQQFNLSHEPVEHIPRLSIKHIQTKSEDHSIGFSSYLNMSKDIDARDVYNTFSQKRSISDLQTSYKGPKMFNFEE